MKRLLFLLLLAAFTITAYGQTVVTLSTADTSKIQRTTGTTNAELILRNSTRGVTNGLLYNAGNGWLKYGIVGNGLVGGSTFRVDSSVFANKTWVNGRLTSYAPASGSANYWTSATTQIGLTGDKTTSGTITAGAFTTTGQNSAGRFGFQGGISQLATSSGSQIYANNTTGYTDLINNTNGVKFIPPSGGVYSSPSFIFENTGQLKMPLFYTSAGVLVTDASGNITRSITLSGLTSVAATTFTGALTGNATTSTTLANTRTIWGQNFNGSANVTGDAVITNIAPAANFTLTQNSVAPFTSVNSGAIANTLYMNAGSVGIANAIPGDFHDNADNLVVGNGSSSEGMTIYAGNASSASIHFADGTTTSQAYEGYIRYDHSTNGMYIGTNHTDALTINSSQVASFASGMIYKTTSVTTTYSVLATDYCLFVTSSGGASYTITLPTAVGRAGQTYVIKRIDNTGGTITIASAGGNIDGSATINLAVSAAFASTVFTSDGTNWYILSRY